MCGAEKPLEEFHKMSKAPDGRQYRCKPCAVADALRRAAANPEAHRAAVGKYSASDKNKARRKARREGPQRETILEQKRESHQRNRDMISERMREKRAAEPERFREYKQRTYAANRKKIIARNGAWQQANIEKLRYQRRQRAYGITPEEFDRRILETNGRCEICGDDMHAGDIIRGRQRTGVCVDHDHATGAIRGLLCTKCNKGIGQFLDDPDVLRSAAAYLERHRPETK